MQLRIDLAAFIVSAVALIVAFGSVLYTRRQTQASERQASASEAQVDAANRQAVAAEAQAEVMTRQLRLMEAEADHPAPKVSPWVVRHLRGRTYALINAGDVPAFDVKISVPDGVIHRGELKHERFDPRSERTLILIPSWGSGDILKVNWSWKPGGPEETWEVAIPPGD